MVFTVNCASESKRTTQRRIRGASSVLAWLVACFVLAGCEALLDPGELRLKPMDAGVADASVPDTGTAQQPTPNRPIVRSRDAAVDDDAGDSDDASTAIDAASNDDAGN